jgi:hypothetical protein
MVSFKGLSGSKLGHSAAAVVCLQATGVVAANAEKRAKSERNDDGWECLGGGRRVGVLVNGSEIPKSKEN